MSIGVRERAKKYSVHDAEDCRVGANAEGKSEDSDGGKAQTLAKHSYAVAQILYQFIEKSGAARFPAFLFYLLDAAKFDARSAHRFLSRNAVAYQTLCTCLDMETEFYVHFAFDAGTTKRCLQPRTQPAPNRHTSSGLVPRIPPMTSAMLFQFSVSACKRRFPAAVSV